MRFRLVIGALVAALLVVTVAIVGGRTGRIAAASTQKGRIVFAREKCAPVCAWHIVAADPNDAKETVLAGPYPSGAFDEHLIADWSPNGATVIFMANQAIWQVNADATHLHRVWAPPPGGTGLDDGPTFTPDGKHIVFTRCCPQGYGYSLWMINSDGRGLRDLTKEPVVNGDGPADTIPQVAPNGKRIVFNRCFPDGTCAVTTVKMDGRDRKQLTDRSQLHSEYPHWSPDSKLIVFEADSSTSGPNIATISADGAGLRLLNHPEGNIGDRQPCFSPTGEKILYSRSVSAAFADLFTMNPDGTDIARITRTASAEFYPQWATAP
jgi:TolB protein